MLATDSTFLSRFEPCDLVASGCCPDPPSLTWTKAYSQQQHPVRQATGPSLRHRPLPNREPCAGR